MVSIHFKDLVLSHVVAALLSALIVAILALRWQKPNRLL